MLLSNPDTPDENREQQNLEKRENYSISQEKPSELNITKNHAKAVILWHSLGKEEVFKKLATSSRGLDPEEAATRLQEYGINILPTRKPPGLAEIVLHQFKSPLIYILLIAGIISVLLDDLRDAGFIFLVVVINAVIGTIQEWKAEKSASQLQTILKICPGSGGTDLRLRSRQRKSFLGI